MSGLKIIRKPFHYAAWNSAYVIIGINIAVYIILKIFPNLIGWLCLNVLTVTKGKMFWQFFTYMFVHDPNGITHLLFNMLGVFFFGVSVERMMGSKEFLLFYLTSGVFCGLASFLIYYFTGAYYAILLGASGALYALLFSFAVLRPSDKIYIWGILPVPAPILVAAYAGIEIASQLFNFRSGVAHLTHLAGFAFAWLYFVVRVGVNPWRVWKNAYR